MSVKSDKVPRSRDLVRRELRAQVTGAAQIEGACFPHRGLDAAHVADRVLGKRIEPHGQPEDAAEDRADGLGRGHAVVPAGLGDQSVSTADGHLANAQGAERGQDLVVQATAVQPSGVG